MLAQMKVVEDNAGAPVAKCDKPERERTEMLHRERKVQGQIRPTKGMWQLR